MRKGGREGVGGWVSERVRKGEREGSGWVSE